jgi:hypothetical protein
VKKYLKLWILPLVLVVVSFAMRNLAGSAWDSLVHFKAPQFTVDPGDKADPIARVVIVVVDGLRIDAFNKMKFVSSLKENGAYFTLKTGQPSLTMPCSTVIAMGAWQDVTGVTTNWFEGPVRQDSLFSLAKDSGMTSAIAGGDAWGQLFGSAATKIYTRKWEDAYITFDEQTLQKAIEFLSEGAELLLVHFVDTDEAGHDFGGASSQYLESADHIDKLIGRLYPSLPEDAVLMVTADHGQIDRGGHGGWEDIVTNVPLLMSGKTVRPGSYGKAEQTDIAPTAAALLGLPMPPYSQGRILNEAVNLDGQKAHLQDLLVEQKRAFTKAYLEAIGADFDRVRRENQPGSREDAAHYWDKVLAKGKEGQIAEERVNHIPLFLVVLLIPLLVFWQIKKRFRIPCSGPFWFSLLYFVIYYGIFFASGKSISLSSINEEDLLQRYFNQVMLYAGVSAVLVIAGLAFMERWKSRYEAARSSVILIAFIAFLTVVQIDIFFLENGPLIGWHIPSMFLAFKYYLDMMSLITLGFLSVALPFVSMGTHWIWRRERHE